MRPFGDLSAARLAAREYDYFESEVDTVHLKTALPQDGWHAVIVELCLERFRYCYSLYQSSRSIFQTDLQRRNSSDGYTFGPLPVRISWGVGEMASLINSSEYRLNQFEQELNLCRQQASFGTADPYEQLARRWLRHSRDLRRRTEYSLQAAMWVQWTVESLWQAGQIAGHLLDEDSHHLSSYGPEAFSYLAHPPLFVAVMAAASMVEEVGAFTVKELDTGIGPDMNETRLEEVLGWLSECDLIPDDIDADVLDNDLRSARNELAHSMMARSTTVTLQTFEDYVAVVWEAFSLTNHLAEQLLENVFVDLNTLPLTPR